MYFTVRFLVFHNEKCLAVTKWVRNQGCLQGSENTKTGCCHWVDFLTAQNSIHWKWANHRKETGLQRTRCCNDWACQSSNVLSYHHAQDRQQHCAPLAISFPGAQLFPHCKICLPRIPSLHEAKFWLLKGLKSIPNSSSSVSLFKQTEDL